MKKILLLSVLLAGMFAATAPASAAEGDMLSLGVGYYDILDDEGALDVRAEWRSGYNILAGVKPMVSLEATSDAALYGAVGLYRDFAVAPNWYLTPSFNAGLYHDGDGKDLGDVIEFRSQIELGYEFSARNRVSVGFGHLSNAGLDDRNPGTEVLNLYYHMPWN